jgi:putative ABC transport system substrate-binding protein
MDRRTFMSSVAFGLCAMPLAELALKHRLPGAFTSREYAAAGGLMSYGPDYPRPERQHVRYIDRILRGANPGDLPIEQPTKFELVINLKTAKALGLTIPQSVLARCEAWHATRLRWI